MAIYSNNWQELGSWKLFKLIKNLFSMAGKLSFEEGASIYKPPLFCGLNYKFWVARMKIFIESIDQRIWDSIENGLYIPKFKENNSFISKPLSQWTNDECKMAQLDRSAQKIIASALDTNNFSGYQSAKLLRICGTHSRLLMNQRKQWQRVKQEEKGGKIRKDSIFASWPEGRMTQVV